MDHLDDMLSRLREAPLDPRLAGLDSRVMAEIARLQAMPRLSATTFGVAAAVALFIGIAGSAGASAFGRCCGHRPSTRGSRSLLRRC